MLSASICQLFCIFSRFVHFEELQAVLVHKVSRQVLKFTLQPHHASIRRVMVLEFAGKARSTCTGASTVREMAPHPAAERS
jgi:hypothetical protein